MKFVVDDDDDLTAPIRIWRFSRLRSKPTLFAIMKSILARDGLVQWHLYMPKHILYGPTYIKIRSARM